MKLLRAGRKKFQFELAPREKHLLFLILRMYPAVPAAHHRLSKDRHLPNREENQQLLEDALQAQRQENRRQVGLLLNEPERFVERADGWRASFSRGEIEWLLQVLNDVRVGSWLALGSPDQPVEVKLPEIQLTRPSARHAIAMELAGFFEMNFLHALTGGEPPGHD